MDDYIALIDNMLMARSAVRRAEETLAAVDRMVHATAGQLADPEGIRELTQLELERNVRAATHFEQEAERAYLPSYGPPPTAPASWLENFVRKHFEGDNGEDLHNG